MRIATGESQGPLTEGGKNAAAVALGRMGGKARAAGLTARRGEKLPTRKRWKTAARE